MVIESLVNFAATGNVCASVDSVVAHYFRDHLTTLSADVLLALSAPGSDICVTLLLLLAAGAGALRHKWLLLLKLFLSVGGGALLAEGIKLVVQRPRPFLGGPFGLWGGYSFPSGHTTAATVLYASLTLLALPLVKTLRARVILCAVAGSVVVLVGFSRIALGAHYLSDVVGATVMGLTWVALCSALFHTLGARRAVPAVEVVPALAE